MIELLISLLILAIIIYAVIVIMGMIPLPPPIRTLVYLIVGLILLVALLDRLGFYRLVP